MLNRNGEYYHAHWMSRHRIPPLPWWLVGWFVMPLEIFCVEATEA